MFVVGHLPNMFFYAKVCSEPYEASKIKVFAKIRNDFESFLFWEKGPSSMFDRFLSMPLRPV